MPTKANLKRQGRQDYRLQENKGKFAYRSSNFKSTKLHQNSFNHSQDLQYV